jgi:hypothetical protein
MNANDLTTAAMQLNLDAIKTKLMHAQSGEGWSREKADAVEKEYRRFLCLMKLYPNEATAPLVDVDTFWHYHILDTLKYAADCTHVFGYFLHHYPYIGMRGEGDEKIRIDSGARMKALYEATFGEAYPAAAMAGRPAATTSYRDGLQRGKDGFPMSGIYLGTAYCGGPWPDKAGIAADTATAYCGGPWPDKAGPAGAAATDTDTAYCGGPWPDKAGSRTKGELAAVAVKGSHTLH